jgi:hypothetical protein
MIQIMIREDCSSCKNVSELIHNSSTLIFAKENNYRIMCDEKHIVYNPMEEV